MVSVKYYTDPACPWSWAAEPSVRKLMMQFGDALRWTFVMGGLARDFRVASGSPAAGSAEQPTARLIRQWLRVASETRAPIDPLLWVDGPIDTSYPACMAVKAAAEQAPDGGYRYLRRLREGLMCERRKLDHVEALVEEARLAALNVERFRIDLRSHAITEAFAEDLEETKRLAQAATAAPPLSDAGSGGARRSQGAGGAPLPSLVFTGDQGVEKAVLGLQPYEAYREAALGAGAAAPRGEAPSIEQLVARFGRVTTAEVEAVCELQGPRAGAELFRLAEQWRLRPAPKLTGYLWEPVDLA